MLDVCVFVFYAAKQVATNAGTSHTFIISRFSWIRRWAWPHKLLRPLGCSHGVGPGGRRCMFPSGAHNLVPGSRVIGRIQLLMVVGLNSLFS